MPNQPRNGKSLKWDSEATQVVFIPPRAPDTSWWVTSNREEFRRLAQARQHEMRLSRFGHAVNLASIGD